MCNTNESMVQVKTCLPSNPSVVMGDAGTKPLVINPNLPQSNAFSAYGYIPVKIAENYFKPEYRGVSTPPPDPFFTALDAITTNEVEGITALLRNYFPSYIKSVSQQQIEYYQEANPNFDPNQSYSPSNAPFYTRQRTITVIVEMFADKKLSDVVAQVNLKEGGIRVWKPVINGSDLSISTVSYTKRLASGNFTKKPQLTIVEEYRVASFLGQYGLGRTVGTFSLLPGEKTTIRIKTYRDVTSTRSQSENIIDSQSKESFDELEKFVQEEKGSTSSSTTAKEAKLGFSFSPAKLVGLNIDGSGSISNSSTRTSNAQALNKALDKHTNKSNANRQVSISTSSTETVKEGDETSTEREIVNYNKSRVLNFIFRQLHQDYINITYLADIKIAFSTGTEDSLRVVSLEELSDLLDEIVDVSTYVQNKDYVTKDLLKHYVRIKNTNNKLFSFLEQAEDKLYFPTSSTMLSETVKYWRKANVQDEYDRDGINVAVEGVILNVQKTTLKTSSVLVEALLGQADALDCFNLQIQDSESQKGYMELQERAKRLSIEESRASKEQDKVAAEVEKLEAERAKIAAEAALITNVIGSADVAAKVELAKEMYSKCCPNGTTPHLVP
jgi:hypothetical protein